MLQTFGGGNEKNKKEGNNMDKKEKTEINKIIKEVGLINDKMKSLDKASKVNFVFDKMDKETQVAVKGLINHLQMARLK